MDEEKERKFDDLVDLHDDVKKLKINKSFEILKNFHSHKGTSRKFEYILAEKEIEESRLNLSSTNICTYALSQYMELWKENDIKDNTFGPLEDYYKYIVDGLNKSLTDGINQSLESTDEFSSLNILFFLKKTLDEIRKTKDDNGWYYCTEKIIKILNLIWDEYNSDENKKLEYQDNTHPFIHYTFLRAILDWREEILSQKIGGLKTPDDFYKVAEDIYKMGKYEMYRQIALKNANDGSLFDVKRLIYSLLIVTRDNRYSNDKIKTKVLDMIFDEQLETGLWPIGNVVNNDFVIEQGKIKSKRNRIINISPILSSIECLNAMLMHEDIAKELKKTEYQTKLKKTYEWISSRLREDDTDFLLYERDIRDGSKILDFFSKDSSDLSLLMIPDNEKNELRDLKKMLDCPETHKQVPKRLVEILNRLLLQDNVLCGKGNIEKISDLSDQTKDFIKKKPDPEGDDLRRLNRMILGDCCPQGIAGSSYVRGGLDRPLGWYPEYEGTHTPKSWVAGHTLVFLKKYCELLSKLIEESAAKRLQAKESKDLVISWDDLSDSYGMKSFLEYMDPTNSDYRSAFVFGPPGTGKSTIAKALAKKLKWNYVEITPGQFLEDGERNIIKTANFIFKRLKRMKETVIFFDEVDQFVELRKESTGASAKWIVTALLPQIQELRKQKNIIFILATNNITKVDPAMKRRGRVDFVLPMGPICWRDRMKMLSKEICKVCNDVFSSLDIDSWLLSVPTPNGLVLPDFVESSYTVVYNDLIYNDLMHASSVRRLSML